MTIQINSQYARPGDAQAAQSSGVLSVASTVEKAIIKISSAIGLTLINGLAACATAYCGQPVDIRNYKTHISYYTIRLQAINSHISGKYPEIDQSLLHYLGSPNNLFAKTNSMRANIELSTYMSYPGWSDSAPS